jgi:hypothetical protein
MNLLGDDGLMLKHRGEPRQIRIQKVKLHYFRKTERKIATGNLIETVVLLDFDPEQSGRIRAGIFPL